MRIIGILLTLLGVVLLASPLVIYSRREKVIDTESIQVTAKRQKGIVIPPAVGLLTIGAGVGIFIFAGRNRNKGL
jgi:hypothetical protein